jgi:peptidoglycan/LPS O-acetylase OafA/YrhL
MIKYRPEIDGLRAIAVIAVILFHFGFSFASGGYIGVDVFFTISGFLITSIVIAQHEKKTFSIVGFYQSRIQRLLPALFVVLFATSIVSWVLLLPDEFVGYAKSLTSSLLYSSNVWFYFEDAYHSVEALKKPLLHTWSLSVEEQFYFIYPFLFTALLRIKKHTRTLILICIFFISLVSAEILSTQNDKLNFYSTFSRAWEFLIGVGAYFYLQKYHDQKIFSKTLSIISILTLLLFFYNFDGQNKHPSLLTLIPVLATAILLVKSQNSGLIYKALSCRLMSWIGRLSYSLYLWHFPILAFYFVRNDSTLVHPISALKLMSLTLILSVLTHYFIENPLRYGKKIITNLILIISFTLLSIYGVIIIKSNGFSSRLGNIEGVFSGTEYQSIRLEKDGNQCMISRNGAGCRFDELPDAKRIISMGDSHAYTINNSLRDLALKNNYNFEAMNLTHCPYVIETWRHTGFKLKCTPEKHEIVRSYLLSIEPSIIIYTVRFPMYLNSQSYDNLEGGKDHTVYLPLNPSSAAIQRNETLSDLIVKGLNELADYGHTVIVNNPIPEVGWDLPQLIKSKLDAVASRPVNLKIDVFKGLNITTSYSVYKKRIEMTESILNRLQHKNIIRIYPDDIFCSNETDRCSTHNDKLLFYRDNNHLSQNGAKLLAELIFTNLLKKR